MDWISRSSWLSVGLNTSGVIGFCQYRDRDGKDGDDLIRSVAGQTLEIIEQVVVVGRGSILGIFRQETNSPAARGVFDYPAG
jgi:hypothetical protein